MSNKIGLTYCFKKNKDNAINSNNPEKKSGYNLFEKSSESLASKLVLPLYNLFSPRLYNLHIDALNPVNKSININIIPIAPSNKITINKNNIEYAILLNNLFYVYLDNSSNPMNINNFNQNTIKFYNGNKDKKPIGFSMLSHDKKTIIIVFRGSQTISDFIIDTEYNYYKHNNSTQSNPETVAYACRGFAKYYNNFKDNLLEYVKFNNTNKKLERIFITGHSLGASLAEIVAYNLSNIYNNVELYAISPSKTGNIPFANSISAKCKYAVSVINLADCVPSLILSYMYNSVSPHIPCCFSHVHPIAIFNNLKPTIGECHALETYYEGVKKLNPIIIPNL